MKGSGKCVVCPARTAQYGPVRRMVWEGGAVRRPPIQMLECLLDGIRDLTITRMAVSVADNDFYCIGPGRQCDTSH